MHTHCIVRIHGNNKHTKSIINRQWKSTNRGKSNCIRAFYAFNFFFQPIAWCIKSVAKRLMRIFLSISSSYPWIIFWAWHFIRNQLFVSSEHVGILSGRENKEHQKNSQARNFFFWKPEIKMVEATELSFFLFSIFSFSFYVETSSAWS